ncbi:MAG TPA: carbonic anhydrase [Bryobacteraceae bacterium]|nr:carbonic anhydrase [Bryobacteraceae bacterium]
MRKVFHFDSSREPYIADAVVIWCFDNRFQTGFCKFLKRLGAISIDPVKIAGGAKALGSPDRESERAFALDQIQKSIRLHETKRVILMVHSDCGAYGGLSAFNNNPQQEAEHHERELRRAAQYVVETLPELEVAAYFVDFEGVWEVELASRR